MLVMASKMLVGGLQRACCTNACDHVFSFFVHCLLFKVMILQMTLLVAVRAFVIIWRQFWVSSWAAYYAVHTMHAMHTMKCIAHRACWTNKRTKGHLLSLLAMMTLSLIDFDVDNDITLWKTALLFASWSRFGVFIAGLARTPEFTWSLNIFLSVNKKNSFSSTFLSQDSTGSHQTHHVELHLVKKSKIRACQGGIKCANRRTGLIDSEGPHG